jgi:hypothetical protein
MQRFLLIIVESFETNRKGHNGGGEDFDTWSLAISTLAKECPNVVTKVGAGEEWGVSDRGIFLDHAITTFGFQRILVESNWPVSIGSGEPYEYMFTLVLEVLLICAKLLKTNVFMLSNSLPQSCKRLGATTEQIEAVFFRNAVRIYQLGEFKL